MHRTKPYPLKLCVSKGSLRERGGYSTYYNTNLQRNNTLPKFVNIFMRSLASGVLYYRKKYRARVKSALFRSSSQSPAIKRSRRIIKRSAVSRSFGNSCLKKPGRDSGSFLRGGFIGGAFGSGHCSGGGGGGAGQIGLGGLYRFCAGDASGRVGSCSRFFLYVPSGCGM